MSGAAYVVGVGMTPIGKHEGAFPVELAIDAIQLALQDAKLPVTEIDGLYTCPHGFLRDRERFMTQRMAQRLDLEPKAILEVDAGGTTSGLNFQHAVRAVQSGQVRCALVYASEVEVSTEQLMMDMDRKRHLVFEGNMLIGYYDSAYGMLGAVPLYAMASQRYMYENKLAPEAIARVSVQLRENALNHPLAQFKKALTVEDVLASKMVAPPIHFLEACPWSNGAAAILVASEDIAKQVGKPLVKVESMSESHDAENFFPTRVPASRFPSVERAAKMALQQAKLSIDDIDVFEIYGAFAAVELMCYEELGLFPRGRAAGALAEGRTKVGPNAGDRPVNPTGGRLSFGHPPYVTPLAEIHEITTQLRGDAGPRQVKDAEIGMVQAEHGMVNGASVSILKRVK